MRARDRVLDLALAALSLLAAPFLYLVARKRWSLRLTRQVHDSIGVTIVRNHYYEPVYTERDISIAPDQERQLPGLDLNMAGQLSVLERFHYTDELATLDGGVVGDQTYHYANQNRMFAEGDADALYSFIRSFKPRTFVEIGCGQSSIVAQLALRKNQAEDPTHTSRHICFEPFHNGWLSKIGADFRPQSVETVDTEIFKNLGENDIVFIDSTHVVRSQGDVEHEYLRLLPSIAPGVLVHVHDIFTPRDYTAHFLQEDRRFWTEQYILEAFLSFNENFEVLLALNDMHKRRHPALYEAFPVLESMPSIDPGSFWMRRKMTNGAATPLH